MNNLSITDFKNTKNVSKWLLRFQYVNILMPILLIGFVFLIAVMVFSDPSFIDQTGSIIEGSTAHDSSDHQLFGNLVTHIANEFSSVALKVIIISLSLIVFSFIISLIAILVLWCKWLYRSNYNCRLLSAGKLQFKPIYGIFWLFAPGLLVLVNGLIKYFNNSDNIYIDGTISTLIIICNYYFIRFMLEIWQVNYNFDPSNVKFHHKKLIITWMVAASSYIILNFLSNAGNIVKNYPLLLTGLVFIDAIILIVSLILIIKRISKLQNRNLELIKNQQLQIAPNAEVASTLA